VPETRFLGEYEFLVKLQSNGDDFMPAIKFDEQQRAKGLRELILHGDVYCLPDHIFILPFYPTG